MEGSDAATRLWGVADLLPVFEDWAHQKSLAHQVPSCDCQSLHCQRARSPMARLHCVCSTKVLRSPVISQGPYLHCKSLSASVQRRVAGLVQELKRCKNMTNRKRSSKWLRRDNGMDSRNKNRSIKWGIQSSNAIDCFFTRPSTLQILMERTNTYLLSLSVETRTGVLRLCCDPKIPFTVSVDLKLSAELAVDPWRAASVSLLVMAVLFQFPEV